MRPCNVMAFALLLSGCAKPIEVIVRDGDVGSQSISLVSPAIGDVPLKDGRYIVDLTASDGGCVNSLEVFEKLKRATFRYSDGTPIPREDQLSAKDENAVAVRGAAYGKAPSARGGRRSFLFFVGTKEQHRLAKPWFPWN